MLNPTKLKTSSLATPHKMINRIFLILFDLSLPSKSKVQNQPIDSTNFQRFKLKVCLLFDSLSLHNPTNQCINF